MDDKLDVEFLCPSNIWGAVPEPEPAHKVVPEWFKRLSAYPENIPDDAFKNTTVKRCSPFRDAMGAGYILSLPWAVRVVAKEDTRAIDFSWRGNPPQKVIEGHNIDQVAGYKEKTDYFKFYNPWIVKTPPGYSSMFIPVLNRGEQPFQIFSGIVETDTYYNAVQFPFYWIEFPYDDVLDAGTPIAQVIPFRREDWSPVVSEMTEEQEKDMWRTKHKVMGQEHYYTRNERVKKNWD